MISLEYLPRRFSRAHMKKVSHDLSVLQLGTRSDRFITGARFFDVLKFEACVDQEIQPQA